MAIYLTNTLTRQKELFVPQDPGQVKMYVCGPTVYDRPHLGNARSAVVYDMLYRVLCHFYPQVTYVRNITDVDDKIINKAELSHQPISAITSEFTECFHHDIGKLNCLAPTFEPRATQYIGAMIKMIEDLIERGFAYLAEGNVCYEINKFKNYGELSQKNLDTLIDGARIEVESYKRNPEDFVLWKAAPSGDKGAFNENFASPWGYGRPGWHIECSAMSKELLGATFDIHGGGADLKFPHHENEIAQSCAANDTNIMARYWVHNGFLTVEGEKMSKSFNNFTTVHDLLERGIEGAAIRLFYCSAHYHKPIDFSEKAISDAGKSLEKFRTVIGDIETNAVDEEAMQWLADDLNSAKVLALAHELAKERNGQRLAAVLNALGVAYKDRRQEVSVPTEVTDLAQKRAQAKAAKNWALADELREQIEAAGFRVCDLADNKFTIEIL